ncbi:MULTISPECIES: hypothetical protein [unclassified Mycobacterium]|uniref:hypothetical protein n=1 Tax=Mycobacterium sp. E2238 TaxID=1834131 RepID=UPI0009ED9704
MLVGSDSRQGLSPEQQEDLATGGDIGSSRTDTILLVHLPELWSGGRVPRRITCDGSVRGSCRCGGRSPFTWLTYAAGVARHDGFG